MKLKNLFSVLAAGLALIVLARFPGDQSLKLLCRDFASSLGKTISVDKLQIVRSTNPKVPVSVTDGSCAFVVNRVGQISTFSDFGLDPLRESRRRDVEPMSNEEAFFVVMQTGQRFSPMHTFALVRFSFDRESGGRSQIVATFRQVVGSEIVQDGNGLHAVLDGVTGNVLAFQVRSGYSLVSTNESFITRDEALRIGAQKLRVATSMLTAKKGWFLPSKTRGGEQGTRLFLEKKLVYGWKLGCAKGNLFLSPAGTILGGG